MSTGAPARLEHSHVVAEPRQFIGARQAGKASADHYHPLFCTGALAGGRTCARIYGQTGQRSATRTQQIPARHRVPNLDFSNNQNTSDHSEDGVESAVGYAKAS